MLAELPPGPPTFPSYGAPASGPYEPPPTMVNVPKFAKGGLGE